MEAQTEDQEYGDKPPLQWNSQPEQSNKEKSVTNDVRMAVLTEPITNYNIKPDEDTITIVGEIYTARFDTQGLD